MLGFGVRHPVAEEELGVVGDGVPRVEEESGALGGLEGHPASRGMRKKKRERRDRKRKK